MLNEPPSSPGGTPYHSDELGLESDGDPDEEGADLRHLLPEDSDSINHALEREEEEEMTINERSQLEQELHVQQEEDSEQQEADIDSGKRRGRTLSAYRPRRNKRSASSQSNDNNAVLGLIGGGGSVAVSHVRARLNPDGHGRPTTRSRRGGGGNAPTGADHIRNEMHGPHP